jgi:hypothetical protein
LNDLAYPVVVERTAVAHHGDLTAPGLVEAAEHTDEGDEQSHRDDQWARNDGQYAALPDGLSTPDT